MFLKNRSREGGIRTRERRSGLEREDPDQREKIRTRERRSGPEREDPDQRGKIRTRERRSGPEREDPDQREGIRTREGDLLELPTSGRLAWFPRPAAAACG